MNFKKLFFCSCFSLICAVFSTTVYAQSAKVTLSPELLVPFDKPFNVGVGGILEAEWPVERKLGLTLATGVETLFPEQDWIDNYTFLPLKGGIKYYVDSRFFLLFNLGAAIGFNDYGNDFLVGGGAGYRFTDRIDGAFRIEDAGFSYLALKVGFRL